MDVQRVAVVAHVVLTDRRARLDRVRDQPVVDDVELGDVLRLLERGIDRRLVAERPFVDSVASARSSWSCGDFASRALLMSTTAGSTS